MESENYVAPKISESLGIPRRTRGGRVLNWRRDIPLFHKNKYSAPLHAGIRMQPSVDLRPLDSMIFDQGQEGSCTANAACGMADFLEIKKGIAADPDQNPQEYTSGRYQNSSRSFVYWNERNIDGDPTVDQGSYLHTASKVFTDIGACDAKAYPYKPEHLYGQPPPETFTLAQTHKVQQALNIPDGDVFSMQANLAGGFPFIIGISVYSSFPEQEPNTGVVPMPNQWYDQLMGGHAICVVGYTASQQFIFRNSWGTSWGMNGYGFIPFEYFADTSLASDVWTFR